MEASNTSKLYRAQNHCNRVINVLRERRTDPFFHDVNLLVDNIKIPTNKMLLAASSPYFLAMFTSPFRESKEKNVPINGISAVILTSIIDFVYTSEILITEENVQDLLAATHLLQFDDISKECMQFLKGRIQPTNCLGIQAMADSYNFPNFVEDIKIFIDENFEAVTKSEEFLLLPHNEVCSIISRDGLRVPSEKNVLGAVVAWIDHDTASRKQHFLLLLKNIRFSYLSEKYVQEIFLKHRLFRDNPESFAYVKVATDRSFPIVERAVQLTAPRRGYANSEILVVASGNSSQKSIEYYNFKRDSWFKLTDMPVISNGASMSVLNSKVYIVGGDNANIVQIYDVVTDQWTTAIGMQFKRIHLRVATLNNCIYAVGGCYHAENLNTVEKFDTETEQWITVAPMLTVRRAHGVGVVGDMLYAVGGDGHRMDYLSSVECYNPERDTWIYMKNMHSKRSGVGVGVLNGLLYAVGGYDGSSPLKSAEMFNPKTGDWTMISDMNHPRYGAAVASANNLLYVIGGNDGSRALASVEAYNPKTNRWTTLQSSMISRRFFHCAAVVDKRI